MLSGSGGSLVGIDLSVFNGIAGVGGIVKAGQPCQVNAALGLVVHLQIPDGMQSASIMGCRDRALVDDD